MDRFRVRRWLIVIAFCVCPGLTGVAQEPDKPTEGPKAGEAAKPTDTTKGTTLIGCLAGPDSDDHYTLTSMQHRMGVNVVGSEDLKQGAGAKVKLTGTWEPLPGASAKKSDATQRFKATQVDVLEEKCQVPKAVTPMSKKKQQQQQQQQLLQQR